MTVKLKTLLIAALALFTYSTVSGGVCNPCGSFCDICDPCDGWSLYGEWLYMKARRSDLDYVIQGKTGNDLPDGKFHCVVPEYENGFRVGAMKACEDFDFGVHYTYLRVNESSRITDGNNGLFPTRIHPGNFGNLNLNGIAFAKSSYCLDYDVVEAEIGMTLDLCEGKFVRPFAGFRWVKIEQDLNTIYQNPGSSVLTGTKVCEDWEMDAYGAYLGAGVDWVFCDCFHLFGQFCSAIYVANFEASHKEFSFSGSSLGSGSVGSLFSSAKKDQWLVITSYDLRLGLGYDVYQFLCLDWNFAVGYEFHKYHCLPEYIIFNDDNTLGTVSRSNQNLGFDGLFVRATVKF